MTESFVAAKKKRIIIGIVSAGIVLVAAVAAVIAGSFSKASSPGAIITSAPASISAVMYVNKTIDPNGLPWYKVTWTAPSTGAAAVTGYRVSCSGTGCNESGNTPIVEGSTTLVERLLLSPTDVNAAPVTFQVSAITATGDTAATSISKTLYVSTTSGGTSYSLK